MKTAMLGVLVAIARHATPPPTSRQRRIAEKAAVVQRIGLHPPKVAIGVRIPAAALRYQSLDRI
jgi:hypothetical protein